MTISLSAILIGVGAGVGVGIDWPNLNDAISGGWIAATADQYVDMFE